VSSGRAAQGHGRGGLLLAAINLVTLQLSSGSGPAAEPGAGSVGSIAMIWFGLIAAAAGIIFDRRTRDR
jgi:hypothetical protein